MNWLEQAPIWLIGLVLLALMMATHEAGLRLGKRARPSSSQGEEPGYLVPSALALLGLLMAFTFSASQERWRLRQDLAVAEANAIGTTFLRYQILDQPWRGDLTRLMRQYVQVRVRFDDAHAPADIEANAGQAAALQARIWQELTGALRANSSIPTLNLAYVQTTNEMFDLAAARRAAGETRVPLSILWVLFFYALVSTSLVGFVSAREAPSRPIVLGVSLLVALAFCLILDLDRPIAGSVQVNRAPMERALADVLRVPA